MEGSVWREGMEGRVWREGVEGSTALLYLHLMLDEACIYVCGVMCVRCINMVCDVCEVYQYGVVYSLLLGET